jgi:hypothetical protein
MTNYQCEFIQSFYDVVKEQLCDKETKSNEWY